MYGPAAARERLDAADLELLVDRRRRRVDLQVQRPGERDARQVDRDGAGEVGREAGGAEEQEVAGAVRQRDDRRGARTQRERDVARSDPHDCAAGLARGLLEGEVAGQRAEAAEQAA